MNKSNYCRSRRLLLFQNIFVRNKRFSPRLCEVKVHAELTRFRSRAAAGYRASWRNSPVILRREWDCTANFWSGFSKKSGELIPSWGNLVLPTNLENRKKEIAHWRGLCKTMEQSPYCLNMRAAYFLLYLFFCGTPPSPKKLNKHERSGDVLRFTQQSAAL